MFILKQNQSINQNLSSLKKTRYISTLQSMQLVKYIPQQFPEGATTKSKTHTKAGDLI